MRKIKQIGLALMLTVGSVATASAAITLFNNFDGSRFESGSGLPTGWIANQFSTNACPAAGCILGDIALLLQAEKTADITELPTDGYSLEVTTDSGGLPGAVVATMNLGSEFNDDIAVNVFSPQDNVTLMSGTNYWVKLTSDDRDGITDVQWLYESADGPKGKWAFDDGSGITTGTNGLFIMSVEAAVVPIPSAVWLMGSALMGLAGIRRR